MQEQVDLKASMSKSIYGALPDSNGRFGAYGGRFVPETLMPTVLRLEREFINALADGQFRTDLASELRNWVGRPTPLTRARHLGEAWGATVWLKREDLAHTGAHKITNAIGQALLAKRLGVQRVVAETGAGQHGVAAAAACARVGLPCRVYMGEIDARRQAPNVDRIKRLGAELIEVATGDRTLRAAIDEAIREWVGDPVDTYYLLGSAVGPHPYPWMVREFLSVIGREAREQIQEEHGLPDLVVACVGGGSNAIGLFHAYLGDNVTIIGAEAGGTSLGPGGNAATIATGTPGVLHGCHSLLIQDENGQIMDTESIAAGLDYPGVGPEHAFLHDVGRVGYESISDHEALAAANQCCVAEGILPALESSHGLAAAKNWARENRGTHILVGLSGRGDKDLATLSRASPTSPAEIGHVTEGKTP